MPRFAASFAAAASAAAAAAAICTLLMCHAPTAALAAATTGAAVEVRRKDEFSELRSDFGCGISVPDGGGVGGVRNLPTCNVAGISFAGAERVENGEQQQHTLAGLDGTAACAVATSATAYVCDGASTSAWARDETSREPAALVITTLCEVNAMALRVAVTAASGTSFDAAEQLQLGVAVGDAPEHMVLLPAGERAATLLASSATAFGELRLRVGGDAGAAGAGVCVSHVAVPCCAACGGNDDGGEQQYADEEDDDALPPRGGCCAAPYAAGNRESSDACAPPPPARSPLVCNADTIPTPDAPTVCEDCDADAERRPECATNFDKCNAETRSGCACAACANLADDDCHMVLGKVITAGPSGFITPADVGGKRCYLSSRSEINGRLADFDCVIIDQASINVDNNDGYAIDLRDAAPNSCVLTANVESTNGGVGRSTSTTNGDYYYLWSSVYTQFTGSDGDDIVYFETATVSNMLLNGGNDFLSATSSSTFGNLDAGAGDDVLEMQSSDVDTTLKGGAGSDSILMSSVAAELVSGGADDDCIIAEESAETIMGDGGNDSCVKNEPGANCFVAENVVCEERPCSTEAPAEC